MEKIVLSVKNLGIQFKSDGQILNAVNHVSFDLQKGKTLGIVGESGSGKSQSVLSLMGLLADNALVTGEAIYEGKNLLEMSVKELNSYRGNKISMIFQDPMTSLNPYLTIRKQLLEPLMIHKGISKVDADKQIINMLDAVKIPDAKNRVNLYPHEFSGGMRQRVVIAMSLLCKPDILIADEPTTALDVTVQAQILKLLLELQNEFGMSMIFITHDLGVVAQACHDVMVMYGGRIMEYSSVNDLFAHPTHPYTQGLMRAMPSLTEDVTSLRTIPGEAPTLQNLPKGCPFATRCDQTTQLCHAEVPMISQINNRNVACHHAS